MEAGDLWPVFEDPSRFAHLRRLDLSHHRIDELAVERLRGLFGDRIDLDQQFERRGNAALRLLSF